MVNFRNDVTSKPNELDAFWLLFGGVLVLLMQLGFGFLKLGGIRVAHTRTMSIKTVFDMSFSGICWWLVGWGIAYGEDANQIVGDTEVCDLVINASSLRHSSTRQNIRRITRCGFFHGPSPSYP